MAAALRSPAAPAPRAGGFTVIELMIALVIFGVLAAIGMPAMKDFVAGQQLKGANSDLFNAVLRARSEAIRRNGEVTLRPASGTDWALGWTIPDPHNTAVALDNHDAVPDTTITGPLHVIYLSSGRVKGSTAPTFEISTAGAKGVRCIKIDLSGRPYQLKTACNPPPP